MNEDRCPCGGFPWTNHQENEWYLFCARCGKRTEVYDSHDKAKNAWREMIKSQTESEDKRMNGLDCLREELEKRGYKKTQIESAVVPAILDILISSENKYEEIWNEEDGESKRLKAIKDEICNAKNEISKKEREIGRLNREIEEAEKHRLHCEKYIDEFNKSLCNCETPEGRDVIKTAQMFVNSVDIKTCYDNTEYIKGLASILSKGEINAIEKLEKIDKVLPDRDMEWIEL